MSSSVQTNKNVNNYTAYTTKSVHWSYNNMAQRLCSFTHITGLHYIERIIYIVLSRFYIIRTRSKAKKKKIFEKTKPKNYKIFTSVKFFHRVHMKRRYIPICTMHTDTPNNGILVVKNKWKCSFCTTKSRVKPYRRRRRHRAESRRGSKPNFHWTRNSTKKISKHYNIVRTTLQRERRQKIHNL